MELQSFGPLTSKTPTLQEDMIGLMEAPQINPAQAEDSITLELQAVLTLSLHPA